MSTTLRIRSERLPTLVTELDRLHLPTTAIALVLDFQARSKHAPAHHAMSQR